jgi:hypothetical protein
MAIAAKKKQKHATGRPGRGKARPAPKSAAGTRARPAARRPATAPTPERSAPAMAEIDADALEFIEAIDRFKREHGRPFPSWSEVLMVLRELGYQRG